MIVAIVRFPVPGGLTPEAARDVFAASAPAYRALPGLHRKYYLRTEDGTGAGGVYLWESRDAAEAVYTDEWRERLTERYGAAPDVEYLDCPVIVEPGRVVVP
jgi:diaminopimelate decarboxylase